MTTVKVNAFELRKLILDTNMPITDDLWKFLNDMDLEHTDRVVFITKDGKESEFVKTRDNTAVKRIMESTGDVIVHCKDCKYYEEYEEGKHWCWVGILGAAKPTDFCSYGKGREDA